MTIQLLDTGPLFAYLSEDDANHPWAIDLFSSTTQPFFTCEAVIAEAAYLIRSRGADIEGLWSFLRRRMMRITFDLNTEFESIAALMHRYANVSMDLADACLVRMSELNRDCLVLTTDGGFKVYRRFGHQVIPFRCPQ